VAGLKLVLLIEDRDALAVHAPTVKQIIEHNVTKPAAYLVTWPLGDGPENKEKI
jgi:hypothetical protein